MWFPDAILPTYVRCDASQISLI